MIRLATALATGALLTLPACHHPKDAVEEQPPPPPKVESSLLVSGTLTAGPAPQGCPWLLVVDKQFVRPAQGADPGVPQKMIPIALDPQYLKDGTRLRFTFRPSRANSGACLEGTPMIIENITVLTPQSARPSGVNAPVDR